MLPKGPSDRLEACRKALSEQAELRPSWNRALTMSGLQPPGFRWVEGVHRSPRTTVVRAIRLCDGAAVILKSPTPRHPGPAELARLRNEARVLEVLRGEGIVPLLSQEVYQGNPVLVLADRGGRSLRELAGGRPLPAEQVLDLAVLATRALATVHEQGYLHRDLNPSNLVRTPSGTLEIIDFGLAASRVEGPPGAEMVGTLAYLPPEQTGRTGQRVDQRADLYSLGATLYELLTGAPPFASEEALEVIHAHVARCPEPPRAVPGALSAIVMKLLAKSPEERYQSARGLLHDLETCRGEPAGFPLGSADLPDAPVIPRRLYGRERQVEALQQAFQQAGQGSLSLCLVHGPSGVGKSSLVQVLRDEGSSFLTGRGDRLLPFGPVVQALADQFDQILALASQEVEAWRHRLSGAVGNLAGLLVETVPAAARLLGQHPPAPELLPSEAAHRLERLLLATLACLGRPDHPVVLFLDDLQEADAGTLRLLESLAAAPDGLCLLVVAAWRSQELDPRTLEVLRASRAHRVELALEELGSQPLVALLEETLGCPAEPLARVVQRKTRGNPFFLRQFLSALHAQGLLRHDREAGRWVWDLEAIEQADITDNVARMLQVRLEHLPQPTLEALQAAACAGPSFLLGQPAEALGLSRTELAQALRPALAEGLLLAGNGDQLRFLHDRVQEAVLASLAPERRAALHLALGRRLAQTGGEPLQAVRHFNQALPLLEDPAERQEVARLELLAGNRALHAGSLRAALELFQAGIGLARDRQLSRQLRLQATSAAALLGLDGPSQELADGLLRESASPLERATVLQVRLLALMRRGLYSAAFELSLEALGLLGERFPRSGVLWPLLKTVLAVRRRGLEALAALPGSQDPCHRLVMSLLDQAVMCGFALNRPDLVPRLMLRMVERSIRFGRTPESSTAFAYLAVIHSGRLGRYAQGSRLGELALRLADSGEPGTAPVRTRYLVHHLVRHWTTPLRAVVESTPDLYRASLEAGDPEFAQMLGWAWCRGSFLCGLDLPTVEQRLDRMQTELQSLTRGELPSHWQAQRRTLDLLMGRPAAPLSAPGHPLAEWTEACNQALIHLLFDRPEEALPLVEHLSQLLSVMPGTPERPYYEYLSCLVWLAAPPDPALRRRIRAARTRLARYARHCPQTNLHRSLLVEAEAARREGHPGRAAELAERAAAAARQQGFTLDEALALERTGRLYLESGRERLARCSFDDARQAWRRWGAEALARRLETRHAALLVPLSQAGVTLDAASVIKASRTISAEIVWERLAQRLLELALENAGAQRGLLILEREGQLQLEAEADLEGARVLARPLGQACDLALSVARYVARTRETVVLEDASADPTFGFDPYLRKVGARSLLAVPIGAAGLLYLENNLAPSVFTRDRVETLRHLSAQVAVSLENARQFQQLQAERELRSIQQARKDGLAAFLGIASHDLKSPLAAIAMWARQLGEGRLDPVRAREHIDAACRRANGLIRTYLDAMAVETGRPLSLNRRRVDLDRLVEDEIDFLLSRLLPEERARVALSWDLVPLSLEADPERLQQVVCNLVGNALEICPVGTPISVSLAPVQGRARLLVQDQGPGIPPAQREFLFRPFERGREEVSSTGLGLWIARVIVEAHHGSIGLQETSSGTCFWLELPLGRSSEALADRIERAPGRESNPPG